MALTVAVDGNCLYNSASLVLCGNQLRHGCLCLLVAEELYFNVEYYAMPGGEGEGMLCANGMPDISRM